MTLNEIHSAQLYEALSWGDIVEKIAVGLLVLSAAGLTVFVGYSGYKMKDLYDKNEKIVQQIKAKNPEDAKAYTAHMKAYTDSLARPAQTIMVGKAMIPLTAKKGDAAKAKQELAAIEDILKKHNVKKD